MPTSGTGTVRTSGEEIQLSSDNGVVALEHSVLTLDAEHSSLVNFISSPGPAYLSGKLSGKQILLSDEAYRILLARFPQTPFLPCQYFRPIVLGNLSIELLPSGESPGSSFLRVQKGQDSLFFASYWSKQSSSAFRKAVFKRSQMLLLKLHANPFQVPGTSARKEVDRLLELAQKILRAQENLVIATDSFGEAQHLASRLHAAALPTACEPRLHSIMKTLGDSMPPTEVPSWLRNLRKHSAQSSEPCVVLVSKEPLLAQRPRSLPKGVWAWLGNELPQGFQQPWMSGLTFVDAFAIHNAPDTAEIQTLVSEVRPSQMLVYGEGAPQVVQWLAGRGVPAELFAPPRLQTLF